MKKNIAIVTSVVPYYYGGNERLAENLTAVLKDAGFNAWYFTTPRNQYDSFTKLLGGYLANRMTDLQGFPWKQEIHQLISLSYPSFVIKHPAHVCWFTHRMREYYDLWPRWVGAERSTLRRAKLRIQRSILHAIDNHYLRKTERLFCLSGTVKTRLQKWGKHKAEVLHPPPEDDSGYRTTVYKPYIFSLSRLTELKRTHLLVESMKFVKNTDIKVIIAGEGEERENLERMVRAYKLQGRIRFLGKITEKEKHKFLSECRAFYFAPFEEEYGIAAVEAMKRSKPVITSPDSGGPLDFVSHEKNGLIVTPEPGPVASAIDRLAEDEPYAKELGQRALNSISHVSWESVVRKLIIG